MAAVPYAHIVAHMLRNKKPRGTVVTTAPNPKDIVSHTYSHTFHVTFVCATPRCGAFVGEGVI